MVSVWERNSFEWVGGKQTKEWPNVEENWMNDDRWHQKFF